MTNPKQRNLLLSLAAVLLAVMVLPAVADSCKLPDPDGKPADMSKPVKVFIIMGQSNTLEFGRVGGDKNGTLEHAIKKENMYPFMVDDAGAWTERKDVRYIHAQGSGGWNGEGLKYPKDTVKQAIRYLCNKGELAVQREGRAKLVRFQPPSAEGSRERQPLTNGISRGSPAFAVREVLGERGSQWTTTTVLAVKAGNRCPLLPTTPTKRTKAVRRILEALVAAGEVPIDHDRKRDAWRVEFDR